MLFLSGVNKPQAQWEPTKKWTSQKRTTLCKDNAEPETDATNPKQEDEQTLGGPKFVPQLYLQRYSKVAQMIKEFDVKKVCVKSINANIHNYCPPTKLREGNVYSHMCLSVHGGGRAHLCHPNP